MDYKYIEQLLERYWQCQTTAEEEQILLTFFEQADVPAQFRSEAAYFKALEAEKHVELSADFDERILSRVEEQKPEVVRAQRITFSLRLRPLFRAAAVVAIVMMVGRSVDRAIQMGDAQEETLIAAQTDSALQKQQLESVEAIKEGIRTATIGDSLMAPRP